MRRLALVMLGLGVLGFAFTAVADEEKKAKDNRVVVPVIVEVTYDIQVSQPPNLIVKAVGEVPTAGYTEPTLTRVVYVMPPADGIQDYHFTAVKPGGIVPQVVTKINATDTWKAYTEAAPWIKGVRIHGIDGGVKVIMFK